VSERKRAKQSPLRDLMLELHSKGVTVKFYPGRPGQPDADVFYVSLPAGFGLENSVALLGQIDKAMIASSASTPKQKLTRESALSYVSRLEQMKRDVENEHKDKRDESLRSSGHRKD
jgi:hypothetical protein